jgi:hypothetical protein
MTEVPDLKKIEREVHATKFKDGLIEIEMGLLLLGGFIFMLFSSRGDYSAGFGYLPWFILYCLSVSLIPILGKKFITRPRMGSMKPGRVRRKRMRLAAWTLGFMVLLQALLVLAQASGEVRPDFTRLLFVFFGGSFVFIPLLALAYFNNFTRGYLHAVLAGFSVMCILQFDTLIPLLGSGTVILTIGLMAFITFLREYPPPEEVTGDE